MENTDNSIILLNTGKTQEILSGGDTGLPHNPKKSYIGLLKFKALKFLENKGFVSQGLKKVLIIWAVNFSHEMCVVVK